MLLVMLTPPGMFEMPVTENGFALFASPPTMGVAGSVPKLTGRKRSGCSPERWLAGWSTPRASRPR